MVLALHAQCAPKYSTASFRSEAALLDAFLNRTGIYGPNAVKLRIKVKTPPYLYCRRVDNPTGQTGDPYVDMIERFLGSNLRQNNVEERWTWVRTTDFTKNVIGQSFAYSVEALGSEAALLDAFLNRTRIYGPNAVKLRIKVSLSKPYATNQVVVPLLNPSSRLSHDSLYQINNLLQQGKLSGPTLDDRFYRLIKDNPQPAVLGALQAMSGLQNVCYDPVRFLKEQLEIQKRGRRTSSAKLEKGVVLIHRVLVTPTKIYCLGPDPETSNRIIRQYHLSNNFLRVNFVDENFVDENFHSQFHL